MGGPGAPVLTMTRTIDASSGSLTLLNFSHPLTADQIAHVEAQLRRDVAYVMDRVVAFDPQQPFADQARRLVDTIDLAPDQWQSRPLVVNLPGFSPIAAALLAELHGRCGGFPAVIRMKHEGALNEYAVAEVIGLQEIRETARKRRMYGGGS